MKITKRQLKRIIREAGFGQDLDHLEMAAMESDAIRMLFDAYLEEELDLSGSNREDALEYAYKSMQDWMNRFIEQSRRDEVNY